MLRRLIASIVCVSFVFSNFQPVHAEGFRLNLLPVPGTMLSSSKAFVPVLLKGLVIHPDQPFNFDFIVDSGNDSKDSAVIKEQSERMIRYFLTALTVPSNDLWVNLSPYEKDRIITNELGQTDMGRDMLAQDYMLKQLTASMIYPEKDLGKEFWSRVYKKVKDQTGNTDIPVNTFNKVWIVPNGADVFENGNAVYVTKSRLKVLLEADYLAMQKNASKSILRSSTSEAGLPQTKDAHQIGTETVRQIILPEIEKEVNEGSNFAVLRQVYSAAILAKWYREAVQKTIMQKIYIDQKKIAGVDLDDKTLKEQIYQRYIAAYKKGVFNYIKEENDTLTGQIVPRKYFSGGTFFGTDKIKLNSSAMKSIVNLPLSALAAGFLFLAGCAVTPKASKTSIPTAHLYESNPTAYLISKKEILLPNSCSAGGCSPQVILAKEERAQAWFNLGKQLRNKFPEEVSDYLKKNGLYRYLDVPDQMEFLTGKGELGPDLDVNLRKYFGSPAMAPAGAVPELRAFSDVEIAAEVNSAPEADRAMLAQAFQWLNNYQHILSSHLGGIATLGAAIALGNVLLWLGNKVKSLKAKKTINNLLHISNIPHIAGAVIFSTTGITLANMMGVNVDAFWLATLLYISGTQMGGGGHGHMNWTKERKEAMDEVYAIGVEIFGADKAKSVTIDELMSKLKEEGKIELYRKVQDFKDMEDFKGDAWRKLFLDLHWPIFGALCYLGIYKPSPEVWPLQGLHAFLQNPDHVVLKYVALFGTLGAGVATGIITSKLEIRKRKLLPMNEFRAAVSSGKIREGDQIRIVLNEEGIRDYQLTQLAGPFQGIAQDHINLTFDNSDASIPEKYIAGVQLIGFSRFKSLFRRKTDSSSAKKAGVRITQENRAALGNKEPWLFARRWDSHANQMLLNRYSDGTYTFEVSPANIVSSSHEYVPMFEISLGTDEANAREYMASKYSVQLVEAILRQTKGSDYIGDLSHQQELAATLLADLATVKAAKEAQTYQTQMRENIAGLDAKADIQFDAKTSPDLLFQAIENNNGKAQSMFHHIQVSDNSAVRERYSEVLGIVREVLGEHASILPMSLDEIHVTIANDDIASPDQLTLTLDQLARDLAEDVQSLKPFDIQLIGPHLMSNGAVIMEYTTSAPGFLYLRKKADEHRATYKLSTGNKAFVPKIMHSTVAVIRDPKVSQETMRRLKSRLDQYRQQTALITINVGEITATHFDENSRSFIESRKIQLGSPAMSGIKRIHKILDEYSGEDRDLQLKKFLTEWKTKALVQLLEEARGQLEAEASATYYTYNAISDELFSRRQPQGDSIYVRVPKLPFSPEPLMHDGVVIQNQDSWELRLRDNLTHPPIRVAIKTDIKDLSNLVLGTSNEWIKSPLYGSYRAFVIERNGKYFIICQLNDSSNPEEGKTQDVLKLYLGDNEDFSKKVYEGWVEYFKSINRNPTQWDQTSLGRNLKDIALENVRHPDAAMMTVDTVELGIGRFIRRDHLKDAIDDFRKLIKEGKIGPNDIVDVTNKDARQNIIDLADELALDTNQELYKRSRIKFVAIEGNKFQFKFDPQPRQSTTDQFMDFIKKKLKKYEKLANASAAMTLATETINNIAHLLGVAPAIFSSHIQSAAFESYTRAEFLSNLAKQVDLVESYVQRELNEAKFFDQAGGEVFPNSAMANQNPSNSKPPLLLTWPDSTAKMRVEDIKLGVKTLRQPKEHYIMYIDILELSGDFVRAVAVNPNCNITGWTRRQTIVNMVNMEPSNDQIKAFESLQLELRKTSQKPSEAMSPDNGGIDLNGIKVSKSGQGVSFQFDPAQISELTGPDFKGFKIIVNSVTPIQSLLPLLGINTK